MSFSILRGRLQVFRGWGARGIMIRSVNFFYTRNYGGYHKIKHFACHRDFFVHQIPRIKHTQNASFPGIKHFRASHWLKIG